MNTFSSVSSSDESKFPPRGSRSVCGTLNNPTDEEIERFFKDTLHQYVCGAIEFAPTTGTRHWQFYMAFPNCVRLPSLKRICPRAHFRACRGDSDQNIAYVKKNRQQDIDAGVDNSSNLQTFREDGTPPCTANRLIGMIYHMACISDLVKSIVQPKVVEDEDLDLLKNFIEEGMEEMQDLFHEHCHFNNIDRSNEKLNFLGLDEDGCSETDFEDSMSDLDLSN